MAYLYKHLETPTWAYFSPFPEVVQNTFVLKDSRMLYVGEAGVKAKYQIGPIPAGTLVVCDDFEIDEEQGYRRVFKFKDLPELVPAFVTAFLKENYPGVNEEWQLWLDWSGLGDWPPPVPEPEPVEPEPEPDPDEIDIEIGWEFRLFGWNVMFWREV